MVMGVQRIGDGEKLQDDLFAMEYAFINSITTDDGINMINFLNFLLVQ